MGEWLNGGAGECVRGDKGRLLKGTRVPFPFRSPSGVGHSDGHCLKHSSHNQCDGASFYSRHIAYGPGSGLLPVECRMCVHPPRENERERERQEIVRLRVIVEV